MMFKIKHVRTADCVVAGYRAAQERPATPSGRCCSASTTTRATGHRSASSARSRWRRAGSCSRSCSRCHQFDGPPVELGARRRADAHAAATRQGSRWTSGKDLTFVPLRPERVVEIRYDHMEGGRLRHTGQFVRWRPDRDPRSCTYDQLEEPVTYDLAGPRRREEETPLDHLSHVRGRGRPRPYRRPHASTVSRPMAVPK